MKKILFVGALAFFGAVNAQQTKFGIKAGYALSKIQSEELDNSFEGLSAENKSKSGYFIGVLVEHKLTDKFALQGEVQYANLGGQFEIKFNEQGINATVQDKFDFNQIIIPISAKYFATPQLALYAGPSIAFSTGYKSDVTIKDSNIPAEFLSGAEAGFAELETQQDKAFEDELKSTNFNLFFGGEYTFYKSLFFDARYTVGLSNYEKNSVNDSKTTMNYFQVGLGYKF